MVKYSTQVPVSQNYSSVGYFPCHEQSYQSETGIAFAYKHEISSQIAQSFRWESEGCGSRE